MSVNFTKAIATTSTLVAAENTSRRSLFLTNYSDTAIWVSCSANAVVGQGILLSPRVDANHPGGWVLIGEGGVDHKGIVHAIHAGSGSKALIGTEA